MKTQIKKLRTDLYLTQSEFAEKIGVYQKDVCRWERGLITPSLKTIKKIQRIFKIKFDI